MTRTTETDLQDPTRATKSRTLAVLCGLALALVPAGAAQARLGDLDPAFGTGGVALPNLGTTPGPQSLDAVLALPDGRVMAAGVAGRQMLVLRLTPNGALDPTFDGDGIALPTAPLPGELSALALAPGGDAIGVGSGSTQTQPSAVRISPAGAVTPLTLTPPMDVTATRLTGVAVLADERIVVGGTGVVAGREVFLAGRFGRDGTPDNGFGGDGWAFADFGSAASAAALAVGPTGAVTLAGQVTAAGAPVTQPAAARFTSTGAPDASFGGNGRAALATSGNSALLDVALPSSGLLATGSQGPDGLLQRLADDGSPAAPTTWPGSPQARGEAIALDSLGGAVVAGRAGSPGAWSLQTGWFTPAGTPATAGGGIRSLPIGLFDTAPPLGLAMAPGDAAFVAGTTNTPAPFVARLAPNAPPTAALASAPTAVTGEPVSFDARASADPEGEPLRFAFDLDGDGSFEFDGGGNPLALRSFAVAGHHTVGVRVNDPRGGSATAVRAIDVRAATRAVPRPVLGKQGVAKPISGTVLYRLPGRKRFIALTDLTAIPNGTEIDARRGTLLLTVLRDTSGRLDGARFSSGRFIFTQGKGAHPVTTLILTGGSFKGCVRKAGAALAAAARVTAHGHRTKRKVRKLWGDGRGRFRTRGKYGAATVRGTKWLTQDRCDGTLVRVVRGKVSIEDLVRHKRLKALVRAGGQILLPAVQRLLPAVQRR